MPVADPASQGVYARRGALFAGPIYFLRHGQTEANVNGIIAGSLDVELTALGRRQAQAAARALAGEPITAIYSSPLRRARETAEPVAQALRLPVEVVPELMERRWGELEGRPRDMRNEDKPPKGAETFEDFAARVLTGLAQIDSRVPLVVAHRGVFLVLCRALEIARGEDGDANALPLRFAPVAAGEWTLEAIPVAP